MDSFNQAVQKSLTLVWKKVHKELFINCVVDYRLTHIYFPYVFLFVANRMIHKLHNGTEFLIYHEGVTNWDIQIRFNTMKK